MSGRSWTASMMTSRLGRGRWPRWLVRPHSVYVATTASVISGSVSFRRTSVAIARLRQRAEIRRPGTLVEWKVLIQAVGGGRRGPAGNVTARRPPDDSRSGIDSESAAGRGGTPRTSRKTDRTGRPPPSPRILRGRHNGVNSPVHLRPRREGSAEKAGCARKRGSKGREGGRPCTRSGQGSHTLWAAWRGPSRFTLTSSLRESSAETLAG